MLQHRRSLPCVGKYTSDSSVAASEFVTTVVVTLLSAACLMTSRPGRAIPGSKLA